MISLREEIDAPHVTFTQEINWRIVNDRRALLDGTCDKLAVKTYAMNQRGDLSLRVPETCWAGTDIGELSTVSMLGEWAYKDAPRLLIAEQRSASRARHRRTTRSLSSMAVRALSREPRPVHAAGAALLHTRLAAAAQPGFAPLAAVEPKPAEFRLLLIAERLAAAFDFMRVHLYLEQGEVWFGELTTYSGGGLQTYDPSDLDATLGAYWRLPELAR